MRIGVFITARLGSTRLPNKALLKIKGKPTIVHLIERVKQAKYVYDIILCTTTNEEDKRLVDIALKQDINYFRGSEKDIIKRHYGAAKFHGIDFIINVDGDDIFSPHELIEEMAKIAHNSQDVIEFIGYPIGMNLFGYRVWCLKDILDFDNSNYSRENNWRYLLTENPNFSKLTINNPLEQVLSWNIDKVLKHLKENTKDMILE